MVLPDFTTQDNTQYKSAIDETAETHENKLQVFHGNVGLDGVIITSSGGITATKIGTGVYRLTHSFGTIRNVVHVTPELGNVFSVAADSLADYATIYFEDISGNPMDMTFQYTIFKY